MTEQHHNKLPFSERSERHVSYTIEEPAAQGRVSPHIADLALHHSSPEAGETVLEHTPSTFLEAMRTDIRDNSRKKRSGKKRPSFSDVGDYLRSYYGIRQSFASDVVTPDDITHFAFCVDRFHAQTSNAPRMTTSFIGEMYLLYKQDAEAFAALGLKDPTKLALSHSKNMLEAEVQQYGPALAIDVRRRSPLVTSDALIAGMQEFKATIEPSLRRTFKYKGDWKPSIVAELCKHSDPEAKARSIFETMQQLQSRFPTIALSKIETWAIAVTCPVDSYGKTIAPEAAELLAPIPRIEYSESDFVHAAQQLEQLRSARRAGIGFKQGPILSPGSLRFADVAQNNWHGALESIDVMKEGQFLWSAIIAHNRWISEELIISTDLQNVYHMLIAFARDASAISEKGQPSQGAKIARLYGPDVFEYYEQKYPHVPQSTLNGIIAAHTSEIDTRAQHIDNQIKLLKERFGKDLPGRWLNKWAARPDAVDIAQRFLPFQKEARAAYAWLTAAEVAIAFEQPDPKEFLVQWDKKLEDISLLYPDHKDLPRYRRKLLARYEGEPATIVEDYFARVRKVMDAYSTSPFVSRSCALIWAESKTDHLVRAARHCANALEIYKQLQKEERSLDPTNIKQLALNHRKPQDAIKRFFANKRTLEDSLAQMYYGFGDYVDPWMINQVATTKTRTKYLIPKLTFFASILRHESLNQASLSLHQSPASPNNSSHGKELLLQHLLARITDLDRKAVLVALGFEQSMSKAQLEEELDIPHLDDYVLKEVIPHLAKLNEDM